MSHCTRFLLSDQQKSENLTTILPGIDTSFADSDGKLYSNWLLYAKGQTQYLKKSRQAWLLEVDFPFLRQIFDDFSPENSFEMI